MSLDGMIEISYIPPIETCNGVISVECQDEFDRRRLMKYYHCDSRLKNRYGIRLNPNIWLTLNNMYWNRQYERILMKDQNPDPLVIFEKYGVKLFGIFDTTFLVFSTFLDPKAGAFGRCAWRNNKVYRL